MKSLALHWKILIGMLAGVTFGFIMLEVGGADFVANWIKPIGTIFVKLLKLIAVPLILASLIKGRDRDGTQVQSVWNHMLAEPREEVNRDQRTVRYLIL